MTIKEMRAKTGMSQSQFAARFRVSPRTLQEWEQGKRKPPEHVVFMMERIFELETGFVSIDGSIEIGSTIYGFTYPSTDIITISPERVVAIKITKAGIEIETEHECYSLSDLGVKFFFTEAEARASLEARQI